MTTRTRTSLGFGRRLAIRWRARRIKEPTRWLDYVRFHEIIEGNEWDLAANFDELNERYSSLPPAA